MGFPITCTNVSHLFSFRQSLKERPSSPKSHIIIDGGGIFCSFFLRLFRLDFVLISTSDAPTGSLLKSVPPHILNFS